MAVLEAGAETNCTDAEVIVRWWRIHSCKWRSRAIVKFNQYEVASVEVGGV